jgi:non-ribosomal peptide synthetase-like protein
LLAGEVMLGSFALLIAVLAAGLLMVVTVPKLLAMFLQEGKTYVRYGVHYFIYRTISRLSNAAYFGLLFGDSALIVHYLKWIGYKLNKVVQTGANFGLDQRHGVPTLCDIGTGTMVSDGLTMSNALMSSSSFRLGTVKIGGNNYLGNRIYYPADGKTGANCLLGTKVMVPVDGPVRENVGLLGSPCFEIPRAVERDQTMAAMDAGMLQERVRAKTRYNVASMVGLVLSGWFYLFAVVFSLFVAARYFPLHGFAAVLAFAAFTMITSVLWFSFLEKAGRGFKPLTPIVVSMYDRRFWQHERYWKFTGSPLSSLFKGTPFKNAMSRLLGVKVGRKVFDDGCRFYDKTLIAVGDYTTLNDNCTIQGHSLEEGIFKADTITIGNGCTLGTAAFVHYGVRMGDNVVLEPDSFLMKGEILDAGTTWRGNPARAVSGPVAQARAA